MNSIISVLPSALAFFNEYTVVPGVQRGAGWVKKKKKKEEKKKKKEKRKKKKEKKKGGGREKKKCLVALAW